MIQKFFYFNIKIILNTIKNNEDNIIRIYNYGIILKYFIFRNNLIIF